MRSLFILLFISIILTSCEKVIDLDLNSADPKLVVEGNISNQIGPYIINLTYTTNFFNPATIPPATGATVIVTDDTGQIDTFLEIKDGIYESTHLAGIEGRTYLLRILLDGEEYKSQSYLPVITEIDSLSSEKFTFPGGPGPGPKPHPFEIYSISIYLKDLPRITNYYRLKTFNNFIDLGYISLINDKMNDGETMTLQQVTTDFKKGDTITMELWSIDEKVYTYYSTLADVLNTNLMSSSAPSNPTSNISNGALGYFCASAINRKSIVLE